MQHYLLPGLHSRIVTVLPTQLLTNWWQYWCYSWFTFDPFLMGFVWVLSVVLVKSFEVCGAGFFFSFVWERLVLHQSGCQSSPLRGLGNIPGDEVQHRVSAFQNLKYKTLMCRPTTRLVAWHTNRTLPLYSCSIHLPFAILVQTGRYLWGKASVLEAYVSWIEIVQCKHATYARKEKALKAKVSVAASMYLSGFITDQ